MSCSNFTSYKQVTQKFVVHKYTLYIKIKLTPDYELILFQFIFCVDD